MSIFFDLKKHIEERKAELMDEAFRYIGQTKAESKLGLVRGGLRELENFEAKILQLQKKES